MEATRQRAVGVAAGLAALTTVSLVLVLGRFCGHLGFSAPDTFCGWLALASQCSTGTVCAVFLALSLAVSLVLRGPAVRAVSRALGGIGGATVAGVCFFLLLPAPWTDALSVVALGDHWGEAIPTVATEGLREGLTIWLLFVAMCVAAWRFGVVLGADERGCRSEAVALTVGWSVFRLVLAGAVQVSYQSELGWALVSAVGFWSCWCAIAGVFWAWGGDAVRVQAGQSAR